MKLLILVACVLGVASATQLYTPLLYTTRGAQHLPIINTNGVPIDTPEVQLAKIEHYAAKNEALLRNGNAQLAYIPYNYYAINPFFRNYFYAGPQHIPIIDASGVPLETPEVQQAKAEHLAAKARIPNLGNSNAADTPEVVAARANHLAAHAEETARHVGHDHERKRRSAIFTPLTYTTAAQYPLAYNTYSSSYSYNLPYATRNAYYAQPYATYL